MKSSSIWMITICIITMLPGCSRIINWGKRSFCQGIDLTNDSRKVRQYIRTVRIYDQFATSAIFDVLWLSDDVREAYTDNHAERYGLKEENRRAFLRRQLEENNHFITFYLLSLYEVPLGIEMSEWTIFITVGGENYYPIDVKAVDLPQEYRLFFDKRFTRFKSSYVITFDAKNIENEHILQQGDDYLIMNFTSPSKESCVSWPLYKASWYTRVGCCR